MKLFSLLLSLFTVVALAAMAQADYPALPKVFQQQAHGKMVLLDFSSEYCGTCQMMMPHIQVLQNKTRKTLDVQTLNLDLPKNQAYGAQFQIEGTPTYFLYNAQGQLVYRMDKLIVPMVLERQVLRLTGQLPQDSIPTGLSWPGLSRKRQDLGVASHLNELVLLFVQKKDCADCKEMASYIKGFEQAGQKGLHVIDVDAATPAGQALVQNLALKNFPTFILLDNTKIPQPRHTGILNSRVSPNSVAYPEIFRLNGKISPRFLWGLIRLFGQSNV